MSCISLQPSAIHLISTFLRGNLHTKVYPLGLWVQLSGATLAQLAKGPQFHSQPMTTTKKTCLLIYTGQGESVCSALLPCKSFDITRQCLLKLILVHWVIVEVLTEASFGVWVCVHLSIKRSKTFLCFMCFILIFLALKYQPSFSETLIFIVEAKIFQLHSKYYEMPNIPRTQRCHTT